MNKAVVSEMRSWCEDCFEDMPIDASDDEVLACVKRQYDGGMAGFMEDIKELWS